MPIDLDLVEWSEFRLESKRLLLVPISYDFEDHFFEEFTDEVSQYMQSKPPRHLQDTQLYIKVAIQTMARGLSMELVILDKTSLDFLGYVGIHSVDSPYPEFGIWIKASAHGHAFGLEAIDTLKAWAELNLDFEYLRYPVDVRNYPSRRIPEKLGGIPERNFWVKSENGFELEIIEYRFYHSKTFHENGG
ncbi:MAG TPA: GNAT family N-acetyltransferase [Saprospiraceae bacterium]|nr:GNAT family N-acetyltransferase [Saprospiraceae bacterium]HMQ83094.1 GNAT family N-acetyltransferase [Saprospiraceae bacterium]